MYIIFSLYRGIFMINYFTQIVITATTTLIDFYQPSSTLSSLFLFPLLSLSSSLSLSEYSRNSFYFNPLQTIHHSPTQTQFTFFFIFFRSLFLFFLSIFVPLSLLLVSLSLTLSHSLARLHKGSKKVSCP